MDDLTTAFRIFMKQAVILITFVFIVVCRACSDNLRSTNVFLEARIPAVDREWIGSDYLRVADVLSTGKVVLPRFSDKNGKALLLRITSTNNFSMSLDTNIPIQMRMEDLMNLQQGVGDITKSYVVSVNHGENLHEELAALLAFNLYISARGIELSYEFLPTIPKDENYSIRINGFDKVKAGLTTIFVGAELSLSEKVYSPTDLSKILKAMAATFPTINKIFSDDYRGELRQKLEADKAHFKSREDLGHIDKMLTELKVR
jgi:hypothetical protein